MNTSYPTRKSPGLLPASSILRGAAIQLGMLLAAVSLVLVTGTSLASALTLGPVSLLAQTLVGLGIGATLAGVAALAAYATPLGREIAPATGSWISLLFDGLLAGLVAGVLFHAVLQPLAGILSAAALFALLETLSARFPLFAGRRIGGALLAVAVGIAFGLLFQRFGLAAALSAHTAFRTFSLVLLSHLS
jgi:hypothetical protein